MLRRCRCSRRRCRHWGNNLCRPPIGWGGWSGTCRHPHEATPDALSPAAARYNRHQKNARNQGNTVWPMRRFSRSSTASMTISTTAGTAVRAVAIKSISADPASPGLPRRPPVILPRVISRTLGFADDVRRPRVIRQSSTRPMRQRKLFTLPPPPPPLSLLIPQSYTPLIPSPTNSHQPPPCGFYGSLRRQQVDPPLSGHRPPFEPVVTITPTAEDQ